MRSAAPMPGNSWPHDMVIHVDDDNSLLELLWVREAWALDVRGDDVPPPLIDRVEATTVNALRRDKGDWEHTWPQLWAAALDRRCRTRRPDPRRRIPQAELDRLSETQLLAMLSGPTWRSRFGDSAFDDGYQSWADRLGRRRNDQFRRPLSEEPERRSLNALITAWQRGLTTIVPIPCTGTYSRTLGDDTLLITETTREDPRQYSSALTAFAPPNQPAPRG